MQDKWRVISRSRFSLESEMKHVRERFYGRPNIQRYKIVRVYDVSHSTSHYLLYIYERTPLSYGAPGQKCFMYFLMAENTRP